MTYPLVIRPSVEVNESVHAWEADRDVRWGRIPSNPVPGRRAMNTHAVGKTTGHPSTTTPEGFPAESRTDPLDTKLSQVRTVRRRSVPCDQNDSDHE